MCVIYVNTVWSCQEQGCNPEITTPSTRLRMPESAEDPRRRTRAEPFLNLCLGEDYQDRCPNVVHMDRETKFVKTLKCPEDHVLYMRRTLYAEWEAAWEETISTKTMTTSTEEKPREIREIKNFKLHAEVVRDRKLHKYHRYANTFNDEFYEKVKAWQAKFINHCRKQVMGENCMALCVHHEELLAMPRDSEQGNK